MLKGLFKKKKIKYMKNKMPVGTYLSTITLNANGLNVPIKRYIMTEWITKHDPCMCCLQETSEDIHRLKVKG